jgi:hypothetical protein
MKLFLYPQFYDRSPNIKESCLAKIANSLGMASDSLADRCEIVYTDIHHISACKYISIRVLPNLQGHQFVKGKKLL